ncbi:MAG: cryptochrome/photolyase family protein [Crocinitomicaceae bacterium]|nr:cryptochrome/photolyase family protein [Crocinitomicaceae bacterium]MDP4865528.1 cryptochrome/photolyase family protein [Crocinitomicaceae bacterium]MDP5010108.1 cryptochrome/photolyase family protein [Crocinitomicaceae bacterium]
MSIGILFPHQLFEQNSIVSNCETIYLVEEYLFFKQYNFHKQKLAFHRASMKFYADFLKNKGVEVVYIEANDERADIRKLLHDLSVNGITAFEYMDTSDCWLEKRISEVSAQLKLSVLKHATLLFMNTSEELSVYFAGKKRLFQTDFYKFQRQKRNLLLEQDNKPLGGKWTFDDENRLKYPKGKVPPLVNFPPSNCYYTEAFQYVDAHFSANYGELNSKNCYPVTFEESKAWLNDFFKTRFAEFGPFEDAIVSQETFLNHSILSPMINVGLLTPNVVIDEAIDFASHNDIPLNSLEGFVRQIVGWREFIRAVYELKGTEERTKNYWGFKREIPASFWNGTTGIEPIDLTIKKVLETGYCHHIERLMVLGNFMLLCEFDPDEVYRWFMEMFIDAYDWVMVPNVYGMSQFADGGLMSTKPYISGSNYLMKMSDYKKGEWQVTWDGLFWRFMHVHRDFFLQNPRIGMLVHSFDKMSTEKKEQHLNAAEKYLKSLDDGNLKE